MRSFVKLKPSRNGKITLLFIDIGKSCLSREFFTSLVCLLMLFAKIKVLAKSESTVYSKTCVKRPRKNRQKKIVMTNGSLMKVESIAFALH